MKVSQLIHFTCTNTTECCIDKICTTTTGYRLSITANSI